MTYIRSGGKSPAEKEKENAKMDKIIVMKKNGQVEIFSCRDYTDFNAAKEKYQFVASEWDYSARTGNPINHYFNEI